jgi:hypothetical protein
MTIDQNALKTTMLDVLDETCDLYHNVYLDPGTSLLETLRGIDHEQASIPVGGRCATLAAQVAHVTFYLEVLARQLRGEETGENDWEEIWQTVGAVTAEEWDALRADLERTYRRIEGELRAVDAWEVEPHVYTILPITVHTAYHLGEIRQALCVIA